MRALRKPRRWGLREQVSWCLSTTLLRHCRRPCRTGRAAPVSEMTNVIVDRQCGRLAWRHTFGCWEGAASMRYDRPILGQVTRNSSSGEVLPVSGDGIADDRPLITDECVYASCTELYSLPCVVDGHARQRRTAMFWRRPARLKLQHNTGSRSSRIKTCRHEQRTTLPSRRDNIRADTL